MITGALCSSEAYQRLWTSERVVQALGIQCYGVILGHGDQGRAGDRADAVGQAVGRAGAYVIHQAIDAMHPDATLHEGPVELRVGADRRERRLKLALVDVRQRGSNFLRYAKTWKLDPHCVDQIPLARIG